MARRDLLRRFRCLTCEWLGDHAERYVHILNTTPQAVAQRLRLAERFEDLQQWQEGMRFQQICTHRLWWEATGEIEAVLAVFTMAGYVEQCATEVWPWYVEQQHADGMTMISREVKLYCGLHPQHLQLYLWYRPHLAQYLFRQINTRFLLGPLPYVDEVFQGGWWQGGVWCGLFESYGEQAGRGTR